MAVKRLRYQLILSLAVLLFLFVFIYNTPYVLNDDSKTTSTVLLVNHTEQKINDSLRYNRVLTLDHEHKDGNLTVLMKSKVRIFCWILTTSENTLKKAIHINATWAPRCNKYVFVTPDKASGLPSLTLNYTADTRKTLWGKTKRAFQRIYETELHNFDWFLKADDDTYVIVDNLRFMLLAHSPSKPVYFGCRFKPYIKQGYMSGGAGYVLSREALRRFVEVGLPDKAHCRAGDVGAEDLRMGECLESVGVRAGDSRDQQGKHRMLPLSPVNHLDTEAKVPEWFTRYIYYPYQQGPSCCSDYMISFHYLNHESLYTVHNMLYHIHAFGVFSPMQRALLAAENSLSGTELLKIVESMANAEIPPS